MAETLQVTELENEKPLTLEAPSPEVFTDTELLQKIADNSTMQCAYAKKQLVFVKWCTAFLGVFLAITIVLTGLFAPRVNNILKQADEVLANSKIVSDKLAGVDYPALISSIDALIATGDTSITQALADVESALAVIKQFDIETLNSAISDLNKVISPLANLFGGRR